MWKGCIWQVWKEQGDNCGSIKRSRALIVEERSRITRKERVKETSSWEEAIYIKKWWTHKGDKRYWITVQSLSRFKPTSRLEQSKWVLYRFYSVLVFVLYGTKIEYIYTLWVIFGYVSIWSFFTYIRLVWRKLRIGCSQFCGVSISIVKNDLTRTWVHESLTHQDSLIQLLGRSNRRCSPDGRNN